jgi:hypothetical protein
MPEWWGPQDAAILAGELAKLGEIPRTVLPQRVPAIPATPCPQPARSWSPVTISALVVASALLGLALLILLTPWPAARPPVSTPATYGYPGPNGGPQFTTMPRVR